MIILYRPSSKYKVYICQRRLILEDLQAIGNQAFYNGIFQRELFLEEDRGCYRAEKKHACVVEGVNEGCVDTVKCNNESVDRKRRNESGEQKEDERELSLLERREGVLSFLNNENVLASKNGKYGYLKTDLRVIKKG